MHRILVGNPEGKRPLGRPSRRWVDDIKMDFGEVVWIRLIWFRVGQRRTLVNAVMNLRVP
jgi:hypothetical protein